MRGFGGGVTFGGEGDGVEAGFGAGAGVAAGEAIDVTVGLRVGDAADSFFCGGGELATVGGVAGTGGIGVSASTGAAFAFGESLQVYQISL